MVEKAVRWWVRGVVGVWLAVSLRAEPLISVDAVWRYRVFAEGEAWTGWEVPGFDDGGWGEGPAAFGTGRSIYWQGATTLSGYVGPNPAGGVFLRKTFTVFGAADLRWLGLRVDYQDGLVGWLNGVEVLRRGVTDPGPEGEGLRVERRPPGQAEWLDLTPFLGLLVEGTNTFALASARASDSGAGFYVWPEMRVHFSRGPFVQDVGQDRATVVWHGPPGVTSWLEWAAESGAGVETRVDAGTSVERVVRLAGLAPGTAYRYRAVWSAADREIRSEPAVFRTLTTAGDIDFVVAGDTGTGFTGVHDLVTSMVSRPVDLMLHVGDIVYPTFTAGLVDLRCLSPFERLMRRTPVFSTFGNHDFLSSNGVDYLASFWLPTNSVTGTEHYYSFDHGDAHFVTLFVPWQGVSQFGGVAAGGPPTPPMRWLTNDLARTTKPWKIVFLHIPLRTSGSHLVDDYDGDLRADIPVLREALLPVLAEHGVQVVFSGHDHAWERFVPTDGVHLVTTGGGGAWIYQLFRRDPLSAQYASVTQYARVAIRGGTMRVECVDQRGQVVDTFSIRRTAPAIDPVESSWNRAPVPPGVPRNADGNIPGEEFGLVGEPIESRTGRSANAGRMVVNHDEGEVQIGLRDAMIRSEQVVLLFIGTDAMEGVEDLRGAGEALGHPMNRLELGFEGFRPGLVAVLGDEFADSTDIGFRRSSNAVAVGQGVFRLDAKLTAVDGARVRQFNRSPEQGPVEGEENADFMVISLPRSILAGAEGPDGTIRVGAVVATPEVSGDSVRWVLDSGFLGRGLEVGVAGEGRLESLTVALPDGPTSDRDGDGLVLEEERRWGTDPTDSDTDGDGLPDGWEVRHGLGPLSAEGRDGGGGDPDGDGYPNEEEYRSGTDPADATPTLQARAVLVGGRVELRWRAMIGRSYDVEEAVRLPGSFVSAALDGFPRRAMTTNEGVPIAIPAADGASGRWFRIREVR